jgi:hypothetical protein
MLDHHAFSMRVSPDNEPAEKGQATPGVDFVEWRPT